MSQKRVKLGVHNAILHPVELTEEKFYSNVSQRNYQIQCFQNNESKCSSGFGSVLCQWPEFLIHFILC